jgi:cell pole-organizing protein PopZ
MLAKPADYSSATTVPVDTGLVEAHPDAPVTSYHEEHFTSEPAFTAPEYLAEEAPEEPVALAMPQPVYEPEPEPEPEPPAIYQAQAVAPEPATAEPEPEYEDHMSENVEPPHGLLSEEATGAAASSIGALIRSVSADRTVAVSRGGTTIEDIVREEIRPLLKAWLDTQLPSLVERVVRSEIERVVNRSAS